MLVFFCGKMGAGKTTKSQEVVLKTNAVLLSEDVWLEALYPNEIKSLDDYIKYSNRIKPLVQAHVVSLLKTGITVVMDFPANTVAQRAWFKRIYSEAMVAHELIFIDLPDEVCLKQIAQRRNEQPQRSSTDTAAMFEQVTKYFVEPSPDEGFNIVRIVGHEQ